MTNNQVFRGALTALAGILLCTVSPSLLAAQEANAAVYAAMKGNPKLRLVQTNFAGDAVSIIDPEQGGGRDPGDRNGPWD